MFKMILSVSDLSPISADCICFSVVVVDLVIVVVAVEVSPNSDT